MSLCVDILFVLSMPPVSQAGSQSVSPSLSYWSHLLWGNRKERHSSMSSNRVDYTKRLTNWFCVAAKCTSRTGATSGPLKASLSHIYPISLSSPSPSAHTLSQF